MERFFSVLATLLVSTACHAGAIRAAVDVRSSASSFFDLSHVIDKSGLYPSFADGGDFSSYVALNPLAYHRTGEAVWAAGPRERSAIIDLDLGGAFTITSLAFWNLGPDDPSSVKDFSVYVSQSDRFSSATQVGTFVAHNNPGRTDDQSLVQVINLPPSVGRYVRLDLLNSYDAASFSIGFNEVAFEVSAVPEPASAVLVATGLLLTAAARRRTAAAHST